MKVWITKYALTRGLFQTEATDLGDEMIETENQTYFHKNEWAKSKDEAIIIAELKRRNKIASLKKQLNKLEKMRFE